MPIGPSRPATRISIHAPLAGRDLVLVVPIRHRCRFQSTRPLRGATRIAEYIYFASCYFNPRAPCGARLLWRWPLVCVCRISIHAPLAGRDCTFAQIVRIRDKFQSTRPLRGATSSRWPDWPAGCISIHAPLAGRDDAILRHDLLVSRFQSTRPLRGATISQCRVFIFSINFNPRAPCGARLGCTR